MLIKFYAPIKEAPMARAIPAIS